MLVYFELSPTHGNIVSRNLTVWNVDTDPRTLVGSQTLGAGLIVASQACPENTRCVAVLTDTLVTGEQIVSEITSFNTGVDHTQFYRPEVKVISVEEQSSSSSSSVSSSSSSSSSTT